MTEKIQQQDVENELINIATRLLAESGVPHKKEIKLNDSLQRHLGIDSLGRAELFQRVEKKFSLALPDRLLAEAETLNDIANYIKVAKPSLKTSSPKTIITSHGEQAHIDPAHTKTLIDLLLLYVKSSPEKPHIYFQNENGQEEVITYGQLLNSSLRVASRLRALGLQEGETVAIMQPTDPVFFYTFFGTLLAGGLPVPIYPPFRMHMLEVYAKTEARILKNAEVRILVTFEEAEKLSHVLQAFVPSLKVVTTARELLQSEEVIDPYKAKADSFALIQYTSGSTSDPKGVLLSHQNLLANIRAYGKALKITPKDVAVSWLPLYHDMGLIGAWFGSLYHGVPLILMTPFSFLNHPERWLWAIHYHRGTISGAPNFAYELCVRKVDHEKLEGLDLSSWRVAANGAEKVYPRTLEQFADKFARYGFNRNALTPMYGLAECAVALTIPPIEQPFRVDNVDREQFEEKRLAVSVESNNALGFVSSGPPLEGHEVRIVDDTDNILPERTVGNLQFRGPSCMQGYYHNPSATQAVYHDNWIDSGDLAYQADGEMFVTGRRKDLIIKAGRNIYPAEIEELVGNIDGVRQGCVAAFGVSDTERGTEQLIVIAETREKNKEAREAIIQHINTAVASTMDILPDHVILVAPHIVPKTSSGKLQRAQCKTMYLQERLEKFRVPPWLQVTKLGLQMFIRKCVAGLKVLGRLIYTSYLAIVIIMTLIPMYFLVLFSSPSFSAKACRLWAKFLIKAALCPMKVIHSENLTAVSPVIFAANHASYVDAVVMLALLPANTRFVGKKELFATPIIRTFMRKLNCLSVDRIDLSKGLEDTRNIEHALKEGNSILIFPEGTFGYASGLRPFRLGAFKIAAETNVPVCPVALQGTRSVLRNDDKLMWPGFIHVTVCETMMPVSAEWQDVTYLRNSVRSEIAKYCGEGTLDYIAAQTIASKPPEKNS